MSVIRQARRRRQLELAKNPGTGRQFDLHGRTGMIALGLLLVVSTIVLYSPIRNQEFINWDDDGYVISNPHVTAGLNWDTIRWSLNSLEQVNWHPLTWLSHALDCELFGLDAGYHHITSLLIHAANALLLFLILLRVTKARGHSFMVAALFALHPFNVESVAWVAERKNVLSTFFFLLTLAAYGFYARQPGIKRMAAVPGIFVLALASKPMVVTLPLVLLLLDYWPLQRIAGWTAESQTFPVPQQPVSRLVLEKLPLLALSAANSVVTVVAQRTAVRPLEIFSLAARLENALNSYALYIWKAIWPSAFGLFYAHPGASLPFWKLLLSAAVLGSISAGVWMRRITHPYLVTGWLWFLGILVPVIGLVQVGDQAMADRYAYVPIIGLFVMVVWGASDLLDLRFEGARARWGIAFAVLAVLAFLTFRQVGYWQDSVTVWSHTEQVTDENLTVEKKIASALVARGDREQAIAHLIHIAKRYPEDGMTHVNLGVYYAGGNQLEEARREFQTAIRLTDKRDLSAEDRSLRASAFLDLGYAYALAKDYPNALTCFQGANQSDRAMVDQTAARINRSLASAPSEADYLRLALLLCAKGEISNANSILERASNANPEYRSAGELLQYLNAQQK